MEIEAVKLVAQIAISAGAAFLAAKLAAKRFREDKWWEKKMAAYAELVEALHEMKWPPSEHFDAAIEGRDISEDESRALWNEFKAGRRKVWRLAEGSSFLISPTVMEAVREMEAELADARSAHTWEEHLDNQYGAVENCLKKIKELGAEELGVKNA